MDKNELAELADELMEVVLNKIGEEPLDGDSEEYLINRFSYVLKNVMGNK